MPHDVRIESYGGLRDSLRPLFELADDSADELNSYIDAGRVLVAVSDDEIIGHLQLTGPCTRSSAASRRSPRPRSFRGQRCA
jgi:hypothetical protein